MGVSYFSMKAAVTNQMKNDGTNLVTIINREISKYDLKDTDSIGKVLKEIKEQSKENIAYISLADTNLNIVASSDGNVSQKSDGSNNSADTGSSATTEEQDNVSGSIKEGKSTGFMFETTSGDTVYNVSTPFYEGDKLVGTMSIGISLNVMHGMINKQIIEIIIISLIVQLITIVVGVLISKNITTPITNVVNKLDDFAQGDFTIEFKNNRNDETKKLTDALNQSVYGLKQLLKETKEDMDELRNISSYLKSSSEEMEVSSRSVSESVTEVAQGIEEQDSNILYVTKSIDKFGQALEHIKIKVEDTTSSSSSIESTADVGAEKLRDLIQSIEDVRKSFGVAVSNIQLLNEDANKIGQIMSVINSVAEQTNLLALNAAIEAARAGEAGKGFSVVADEIRKLAEQVMESSKSINKIITGILLSIQGVANTTDNLSSKMDNQINMVDKTMVAFKNIQSEVNKTTPQLKSISQSLREVVKEEEVITNSAHEISAISEQISSSTQQISATMEEHVGTMEELAKLADKIDQKTNRVNKNINKFKI
jgi:methyl-accepting chemotaxis protein